MEKVITRPSAATVAHILRARKTKNGWTAKCPAHEDKSPSLSISDGSDGRLLLHCFAGCSYEAIAAALEQQGVTVRTERIVYDPHDYARARKQAQRLEDWRRGWEILLRHAKEQADADGDLATLARVSPQLQILLTSTPAELRALMESDDRAQSAVQVGILDRRYSAWLIKDYMAREFAL